MTLDKDCEPGFVCDDFGVTSSIRIDCNNGMGDLSSGNVVLADEIRGDVGGSSSRVKEGINVVRVAIIILDFYMDSGEILLGVRGVDEVHGVLGDGCELVFNREKSVETRFDCLYYYIF